MQEISPKRPEVGFYPIQGRNYPGNSSIVDYGLGINEAIVKFSLEEAARGIVREFKNKEKILSQKEAIEIAHKTRATLLKRAGDAGTLLHTHAYNLINKISEFDNANDDPFYQGLYYWLRQHDVRPILMEKLLYDEIEGYAGRLDFFGYVDGRLRLMDFKSNRTIQPKMGLQLAGYKHLLETWGYIEPNAPLEMVILHLTPGIAYEVPFFETWENYKNLKKMFWWKFYRYKPDVYYRSPEGAAAEEINADAKKEVPAEAKTSREQQSAQETNVQGHQSLRVRADILPILDEINGTEF